MANDSASALIKCALNCRCPVCRNGAIFQSHFKMNRECPRCHVVFWKDPGETLGAMYLDFAVAAASFLVCWAILAFTTHLSDAAEIFILCTCRMRQRPALLPAHPQRMDRAGLSLRRHRAPAPPHNPGRQKIRLKRRTATRGAAGVTPAPSINRKGFLSRVRFPFPLGKGLGVRFFASFALLA